MIRTKSAILLCFIMAAALTACAQELADANFDNQKAFVGERTSLTLTLDAAALEDESFVLNCKSAHSESSFNFLGKFVVGTRDIQLETRIPVAAKPGRYSCVTASFSATRSHPGGTVIKTNSDEIDIAIPDYSDPQESPRIQMSPGHRLLLRIAAKKFESLAGQAAKLSTLPSGQREVREHLQTIVRAAREELHTLERELNNSESQSLTGSELAFLDDLDNHFEALSQAVNIGPESAEGAEPNPRASLIIVAFGLPPSGQSNRSRAPGKLGTLITEAAALFSFAGQAAEYASATGRTTKEVKISSYPTQATIRYKKQGYEFIENSRLTDAQVELPLGIWTFELEKDGCDKKLIGPIDVGAERQPEINRELSCYAQIPSPRRHKK